MAPQSCPGAARNALLGGQPWAEFCVITLADRLPKAAAGLQVFQILQ
jgi:hypothetical protein